MKRRQFLKLSAAAALATPAAPLPKSWTQAWSQAWAQSSYPTRPVRMIVPFGPGGPTDLPARFIGQRLSENLGRNFVVENVAGASGNIGTVQVARAPADGYTLLVTVNNLVINPSLFEKVAFDPYKDFDPIALAVGFSSAFSVHPSVPAKTVKELIEVVRANPGKYSYASPGFGTPSHLLGEQFRMTYNLDIVHVPYPGSGPAITATISGVTPICFASTTAAAPQVPDGKLRVLAILSKKRASSLPEVPTIAEAGFPGMDGDGWVGALAPAGTPKEIVMLLNKQINEAITLPEVKERLIGVGLDPIGGTPEDFATVMRTEGERWAKVIKAAGLKAK